MKRLGTAMLAAVVVQGCATASVDPELLSLSARAAEQEARTLAQGWSGDAELRYIEGEGVRASGRVFPGTGEWRFVYDAPGRSDQLVVTVTPRTVQQVTRPPQSPPGLVLGDAVLGAGWIDSPQALEAARTADADGLLDAEGAAVGLWLVPTRPPQWIIRAAAAEASGEWRVNARTGAILR